MKQFTRDGDKLCLQFLCKGAQQDVTWAPSQDGSYLTRDMLLRDSSNLKHIDR